MGYQGWALFMDCDMLCRADIKSLWDQRDDAYGAMCVCSTSMCLGRP